jgi:hypothetical protein
MKPSQNKLGGQSMNSDTFYKVARVATTVCSAAAALVWMSLPTVAAAQPFLPRVQSSFVFSTVLSPPSGNGDQNPYGVAFVPQGFPGGHLNPGDILVANFNDSGNLQGRGTSILRVRPGQPTSTFATTGGVTGLTAALGVIKQGFVFVGSIPTTDGTSGTVSNGPLLVLDNAGNLVFPINSPPLSGPWGLAINSTGASQVQVFVSNVNVVGNQPQGKTGTVSRLDFSFPPGTIHLDKITQIGSDYSNTADPLAIVIGPAGLAYDGARDILYVAGEDDDKIFAIPNASTTADHGTGQVIFSDTKHLHGPMGLALAPNGDLIVANNDSINVNPKQPSEVVEINPATVPATFVRQFSIDPNIDGPFGVAIGEFNELNEFAFLNDNNNTLSLWNFAE